MLKVVVMKKLVSAIPTGLKSETRNRCFTYDTDAYFVASFHLILSLVSILLITQYLSVTSVIKHFLICLSRPSGEGAYGESKFPPLNFSTSSQFVFHKISVICMPIELVVASAVPSRMDSGSLNFHPSMPSHPKI